MLGWPGPGRDSTAKASYAKKPEAWEGEARDLGSDRSDLRRYTKAREGGSQYCPCVRTAAWSLRARPSFRLRDGFSRSERRVLQSRNSPSWLPRSPGVHLWPRDHILTSVWWGSSWRCPQRRLLPPSHASFPSCCLGCGAEARRGAAATEHGSLKSPVYPGPWQTSPGICVLNRNSFGLKAPSFGFPVNCHQPY